jgi:hypothetical protein
MEIHFGLIVLYNYKYRTGFFSFIQNAVLSWKYQMPFRNDKPSHFPRLRILNLSLEYRNSIILLNG